MASANDGSGSNLIEPTILFEDEFLVAVDKPAGLVVHSDGRTTEFTLAEWVGKRYPIISEVGGLHTLDSGRYVKRHGILHRLDRETSGVILIAKDDEAFHFLQRQFLARTIKKVYEAFVWGLPNPKEGEIDLPIGRSRSDFRQWTTGEEARGTIRKALTSYRVISGNVDTSYLELIPKTGRTHQLRVHMKAIGHPIVCDKRYESACGLGFERLALHAKSLVFEHPTSGNMAVDAPLPPDFLRALERGFP